MNQTTNDQNPNKKIMRIAVLGVRPADEVMLKGYLRILLRLEAELEWVTANNPIIDLFMIHHEFKNADSVTRLLASRPNSAVLFINRSEREVGQLVGNLLTLPIKELEQLNQWLLQNVGILSTPTQITPPPVQNNTPKQPQRPQTLDEILANRAKQQVDLPTTVEEKLSVNPIAFSFARIVNRLHKKENLYLRLVDGAGTIIAYIHPRTQRIWTVNPASEIQTHWQLQADSFTDADTQTHGKDLVQWLWDCAIQNVEQLQTFLNPTHAYHLKSWVKPHDDGNRHATLKIQTVLEQRELTVSQIINTSQTTMADVKRTLVGLISAGVMTADVYESLVHTVENPVSLEPPKPIVQPQPIPKAHYETDYQSTRTPPHEEDGMKGFLSRLRRKLGI